MADARSEISTTDVSPVLARLNSAPAAGTKTNYASSTTLTPVNVPCMSDQLP
jgi:hypothetical protein